MCINIYIYAYIHLCFLSSFSVEWWPSTVYLPSARSKSAGPFSADHGTTTLGVLQLLAQCVTWTAWRTWRAWVTPHKGRWKINMYMVYLLSESKDVAYIGSLCGMLCFPGVLWQKTRCFFLVISWITGVPTELRIYLIGDMSSPEPGCCCRVIQTMLQSSLQRIGAYYQSCSSCYGPGLASTRIGRCGLWKGVLWWVWNINRLKGDYLINVASNCAGIFNYFQHGIFFFAKVFAVSLFLYQLQLADVRWISPTISALVVGEWSGAKVILVVLTTGVLHEPTFAGTMSSCPASRQGVLVPIKADESFLGFEVVSWPMEMDGTKEWTDITSSNTVY